MNLPMKNLLLFAVLVSLPLLLGGCGKKSSSEGSESSYKNPAAPNEEVKLDEPITENEPAAAVSVSPFLKYQIQGDTVTITGCDYKASGALIIPATIEGKPVTSIGNLAFKSRYSGLTSITIPDSVTSIGSWAFRQLPKLTSITIPNSVTSIGTGAFYECSKLTSITIPDSVTSIPKEAFVRCRNLTSITIPESVTSIRFQAFRQCYNLTSITIPESVTRIENQVVWNCPRLMSIRILGDAPEVGQNAFDVVSDKLTIYRKPEAKGWGDTFGGRPVKLISEKPQPTAP